jgi:hypothetical protein
MVLVVIVGPGFMFKRRRTKIKEALSIDQGHTETQSPGAGTNRE